MNYELDKQTVR